ncbi:MAG: beta-propeller fold lactonase family protein [Elusimicrobia bacterium]|nr:beta-propeller fold lactonase family protein [Elusimicrobiota bacterium]
MRLSLLAATLLALGAWGQEASRSLSRTRAPQDRPVSSSAVAVSPDGKWIAAVNPDSGSITILQARPLRVLAEVPVGRDPRSLCFSPDARTIAVANHGSSDVSLVALGERKESRRIRTGAMPYGVVTDGRRLFVSEFAMGSVAVLDAASGRVTGRVKTGPYPAGLALSADRRSLFVTHFFSGRLSRVEAATLAVQAVAETGDRANLSQSVALSADGRRAYLPQTLSNAGNAAPTFDNMIIPVVNVVELPAMARLGRELVYLASLHRAANVPSDAVVAPDGKHLYVANAGSNDVFVMDLASGKLLAAVEVGANPRGLAPSPDGARLYVDNGLDGTLSVIRAGSYAGSRTAPDEVSLHKPVAVDLQRPTTCRSCHAESSESSTLGPDVLVELGHGRLQVVNRTWTVEATVPLTRIPLPPLLLQGKKLFHASDRPELSTGRWISCASCHPDGAMDGRTWLLPAGPRNTPALFGVGETLPIHWSGDFADLYEMERGIRRFLFGRGFTLDPEQRPLAGRSADLDALVAYLRSLRPLPSPFPLEREAVARGVAAFRAAGCAKCHAPPTFTDGKLHDVGTGDPSREKHARGTSFDTPTLRGLWLTAPYFHDGSAPTLEGVLRTGREHDVSGLLSAEERRALVGYLRTL